MKLSMKEVAFLADRYPDASTISLFATIDAKPDGTEEETLQQKGILQGNTLTDEAKQILDIIAEARHAARLVVRDGLTFLEKYTYRVDDTIALVENQGGDASFSLPENFALIGAEVSQYIGTSARKTTGIELLLPAGEAMTLLALIDLYRHYTMRSYLGEDVPDAVTVEEIKQHMVKNEDSSLVDLFRVNYGYATPEDVPMAVEMLVQKGCATREGGYRLTTEYALFAKNFLVPSTMLLVESYSIGDDGVLSVGGGLGLTAGVCDQVFFLADSEEVEIKAVAGLEMIQTMEGFLACPEL